ncbi:MAG: RluA family pseudouridine synthase [Deltaproteobacteria bacterium]|nr:RluA family pseudouridine synthase [Deltaproteobacteria bacterium]MBW2417130.1 RluA family pseudouridine synthase [Deltaproteobacteria bacterium]
MLLRFSVAEADAGARLDVTLSKLSGVSRAQVRRWIEAERVRVNGRSCRPSQRGAVGDQIEAAVPEATAAEAQAEAIPIDIVYSDADLVVVDKAAGMVVHPAPGHASGTLVNALLHHCGDLAGVGGVLRPGIVHRLDRGTSGILVVAKTDAAHQALAAQFHDHSIERVYVAFVRALPGSESGTIDRPIGRHPQDRKRMSVRTRSGRAACTRWRVEARFPASGISRLSIRPETGRTHQIRVHLSSVGLPVVGDPVYGGGARRPARRSAAEAALTRPALHAASLGFVHPRSGERVHFEAPLPADLARLAATLAEAEG